jgi:hypothetical protein
VENAEQMDTRVRNLEGRMSSLEVQVLRFNDAMLGTTDGKPGIMELIRSSLEASRANSVKLDSLSFQLTRHTETLESLKQDRAKLLGVMFAIGALWTVLAVLLKYVI